MTTRGTLFDAYVMVDWSAASTPKQGRDSIWICHVERDGGDPAIRALVNPPTRHRACEMLREILRGGIANGRSLLVGCDFPFGYASGLAARLGLGTPRWRAVWDEIARLLVDDDANRSNRFAVAAELNRRASGGAFPFWGCPAGAAGPFLAMTHHRRHESEELAERRLSDRRLRRAQPGWKLAGTGSAGSQALTGIPVVRRLRDDPELAGRAEVWPFETGLRPLEQGPDGGRIVFTEIYPSMLPVAPRPGEVKDAAQVRTMAGHFAALDAAGALPSLFAGDPGLGAAERETVEEEEGWVLGSVGAAAAVPHPDPLPHAGERVEEREPLPPLAGAGG